MLDRQREEVVSGWLVVAMVIAHLLLGVLYSVVTPLWESFDEWGHYPYVEYIAERHQLPHQPLTSANDETHQPPLYYILGAAATFWIDTDEDVDLEKNEYSVHRGGEGGINFFLHKRDERLPYRGSVLAAHVTRLVSVLLGTVSVLGTYLTCRTLFPTRTYLCLGATAVTAFWPQLLFMGGVINNDVAVTASSSVLLLFLTRVFVNGPRPLNMLGLVISLVAAPLSKRNGLALVPYVIIGLSMVAIARRRQKRASLALVAATLLVAAAVTSASIWGWDGLRATYQNHVARVLSILSHPTELVRLPWRRLPSGLFYCLSTFFASFGHLPLGVEAWIYRGVAVACLTACAGLIAFCVTRDSDRRGKPGVLLLILHLLAVLAAPAYRALTDQGEPAGPTVVGSVQPGPPLLFYKNVYLLQGRFVLPAISSFSVLLVLGLANLVPKRLEKPLCIGVGSVLLIFSIIVPFRYIRPAYAVPRQLSSSEVEEVQHPLHIQFGDKIELIGYEMEAGDVPSGTRAPVTLYWRCLGEMEHDYGLKIEVLGLGSQVYGTLRLHPGQGSFPTSLWDEGAAFRETYHVPLVDDIRTPTYAHFKVSFVSNDPSRQELKPVTVKGRSASATFGQFVVRAR